MLGPTGPRVLPVNKAVVLYLPDTRLVCGFAGLGATGRFRTEDWLLTALSDVAPPDYVASEIMGRFLRRATQDFANLHELKTLAAAERRVSFMFTGYLYGADSPLLVGALISNFQDYGSGKDVDEAWDGFRPLWITEKRPAPEPVSTYVQRIGMWPAVDQADVEELRQLLSERRPYEAIVSKGVAVVRRVAERDGAADAIGRDLSSVVLFRDPSRAPLNGYHPATGENQWRGVSGVVAMGDELRFTFKEPVVRAVDPPPGATPLSGPKPRRNDRCPCGSGKKYKHCCGK